jgi:hypothetical protein
VFILEGSLPKLRTALNHWRHYTAAVARVSFIRPRIGYDPDRFMTETILRQGFIAERVKNSCPFKTKTPTHHNPFFGGGGRRATPTDAESFFESREAGMTTLSASFRPHRRTEFRG